MPTDGRGEDGRGSGGGLTDGPLMTVAEVAEELRVSRMTVYRLIERGELPAVRVGRSYRVPTAAAAAFLAASRTAPAPQRRAGTA
ncbi:helix-turn-helix domain-containing protein [Pseudokineococcus sp. 1T1Z-3]|uniref:helix-turn-helix domain-containing protein n=1 Tax=Pseudokineococcus sp. 1T1Z-3 TaxID=3132745 RepID=UPI0030AFE8BD